MATIPASAIRRFRQLERMATQAYAAANTTQDDINREEEQLGRQQIALQRGDRWGGGVQADESGRAVRMLRREALNNSPDGRATRRVAWESVHVPELDHLARDIHETKQRIAALRAEAAAAGVRAGRLNGAARLAEETLKQRGWRRN